MGNKKCFVLLLVLLLGGSVASAEVKGNLNNIKVIFDKRLAQLNTDQGQYHQLETPLNLSGRNKLGRFSFTLTHEKIFSYLGNPENTDTRYLQGYGTFSKSALDLEKFNVPVTAEIKSTTEDLYEVTIFVINKGFTKKLGIITMKFKVNFTDGDSYQLSTLLTNRNLGTKKNYNCATPHKLHSLFETGKQVSAAQTCKTVTLIIEADSEWVNKAGSASSTLATMVNTMDGWYRRDLGVSFEATIVSEAQSYSSQVTMDNNYEFPLHNEMREHRPANSRTEYIHFLTTGKPTQPDVDSLAGVVPDLATICTSKANSIGFTIYWPGDFTDTIVTTAHEIGHLFAAEHDDNSTGSVGYIMNSGTNYPDSYVNQFSDMSKSQVSSHLGSNSSCLTDTQCDVDSGSGGDTGGGGDTGSDTGYSISVLYKNNWRTGITAKTVLVVTKNGRKAKREGVQFSCGDLADTFYTNRKGRIKIGARYAESYGVGGSENCQATISDASVLFNMPGSAENNWDSY